MIYTSHPARGLNRWILAASLAIASPAFSAVVFTNPDLEGTVASATLPAGWVAVPFEAAFSEATISGGASPDTIDGTGPNLGGFIFGSPHSGTSFAGGAHTTAAGQTAQEGLQQTVSGFTVGEDYSFSFFQAYVGTSNGRDGGGTWLVYADGVLVGTTIPNTTTLAWDDANKSMALSWEERTVSFTATAESMTLSFMPYDPDGDISPQNGTYMGIDSFSEITPVPEPAAALLGAFGFLGLMRRRR
ncbi:PEP-CTERM sorting domain-containing protein [Luteolibacter luteus]|uniref:PEP-CTERM sorting domain-containing protein n=1 Tax=Luteolibacter luteus TaxID=2728835 RepID=A0A858RR11_9BACT|nr:PEP-CTERM sorting domain-containing protein [Luteolibacter luteus]QJE99091.1 PEP-CTERM sorting domain-containing protein [Luteolibacter luteus]